MSHAYRERIARIPPPLPPPPPAPIKPVDLDAVIISTRRPMSPLDPTDDFEVVHPEYPHPFSSGRTYGVSAEGAGEEVVAHQMALIKRNGKAKDTGKRSAIHTLSDESSELDIPMAKLAPAHKKRRVDKDATDIADELERSVVDEPTSSHLVAPSPAHKLVSIMKGKGKGKQREQSVDSVSATTKPPRKRPGPRKKFDTLPPQTQELLGVASASASVAGDLTPTGSRPASPALTTASATVYELDEAIPPLKRAKKVDDASMLKRVRTLEEAQRKVWMNIARKDITKVSLTLRSYCHKFV